MHEVGTEQYSIAHTVRSRLSAARPPPAGFVVSRSERAGDDTVFTKIVRHWVFIFSRRYLSTPDRKPKRKSVSKMEKKKKRERENVCCAVRA
jgi:hypothetical protein